MDISQLTFDFSGYLQKRNRLMTEDTIRYLFYQCMLKQDPDFNHYVFEFPYNLFANNKSSDFILPSSSPLKKNKKGDFEQELDLYYTDDNNKSLCLEFKFHREPPKSSKGRSSAAGDIIDDLQRLQQLTPTSSRPNCRRLFVYVTDDVMSNYLIGENGTNKPGGNSDPKVRNELKKLYLSHSNPFDINLAIPNTPNTFFKSSRKSFTKNKNINISLRVNTIAYLGLYCPALGNSTEELNCHIRVFEVLDRNNSHPTTNYVMTDASN